VVDTFVVPARGAQVETEVKKSRFIARVARVATRNEAMDFLEQARRNFPDARHHCWAYQIGDPDSASSAAMNDDGEPAGTAGKPILNVIRHKAIGDVMVVVSRYFGGTKLGAGGLVRAYAGAAEAVLSGVPLEERVPMVDVCLTLDFAQEQAVRRWADGHGGEVGEPEYTERVTLALALPAASLEALEAFCLANGIGVTEPGSAVLRNGKR